MVEGEGSKNESPPRVENINIIISGILLEGRFISSSPFMYLFNCLFISVRILIFIL